MPTAFACYFGLCHEVVQLILGQLNLEVSCFLDGDVPCSHSYGVYSNRNLFLTAKVLNKVKDIIKFKKAFSIFYHRHSELIVKYNIGLKTLLPQGISEPIF